MLTLTGVRKSFGHVKVIDDVSLNVESGRTTVLLGASGCGKSTLLRMMIGLVQPDAGQITLAGKPFTAATMQQVRHSIGYVIQDGGLFPHLTADQNVILLARHLGWDPQRIRDRLDYLRQLTGMAERFGNAYPAELSGGQRQRVGLMRALMLDPDLLLLDEPLGALDPIIRSELQADLRTIFKSLQKSVVLVTHDLAEAAYFADEVVLLNAGRIEQHGPMRDLIGKPASSFVTQFLKAQRSSLQALDEASR